MLVLPVRHFLFGEFSRGSRVEGGARGRAVEVGGWRREDELKTVEGDHYGITTSLAIDHKIILQMRGTKTDLWARNLLKFSSASYVTRWGVGWGRGEEGKGV